MRKKIFKILVMFLSLLFISIAFPTINLIEVKGSPEETVLYVDPPEVKDLAPSQIFSIAVKIRNVTNFYGLDLQFRWDPTLLDYVNHTMKIPVETYPDGVLYQPVVPIKDNVDATAGTYWVAQASVDPAPSFNGTGTIFEMFFHVKDWGSCTLEIYSSDPSDKDGMPIPHTVQHGYFSNYEPPPPPPARIYIDPESVINSSLTACRNFTINVDIEVVDLRSFEFRLGFNGTLLEATEVAVNPSWPSPTVNTTPGMVHVLSGDAPSPVTGNITLATITFHVLAEGESVLDLYDVSLTDKEGNPIDLEEPEDGYFNNKLITRLFVHPAEIFDPTITPGSEFNIDIKIENVIDLYGYELNLTYDPGVLTCLGAVIIPPNNDTNFVTYLSIDDEVGYAWINVTYNPPAEPITILPPTTIVDIYFQVQSYGCTLLDLNSTKIWNQYGQLISHEVGDGFFCPLTRDVAVIHVEAYPNMVYPGRTVNITVTVANIGDLTETFNVTAYYDDDPIETKTVTDLAPGQNCSLIFTWNTSGLEPCNNYTIKAEATQVPYEVSLEDNIFIDGDVKIKMIGDINGDDIIDIYDVVAVASIYGSREGDPDWNPEADLAPEWGVINIYDLVTLTSRYGQTC